MSRTMSTLHRPTKLEKMENWFQRPCDYSINIFEDPGYSQYYKSYFGLLADSSLYRPGDIDDKINIGFVEDVYGVCEETDEDRELASWVDFLPKHVSHDIIKTATRDTYGQIKQDIVTKLTRTGILIPPGSNQSNANYFFKILISETHELEPFKIPFVSGNPHHRYDGVMKDSIVSIDKQKTYEFVYDNSEKKRRYR